MLQQSSPVLFAGFTKDFETEKALVNALSIGDKPIKNKNDD